MKMIRVSLVLMSAALFVSGCGAAASPDAAEASETGRSRAELATNSQVTNDTVWRDTNGNEIWAQGGGIIKVLSTWYWIGAAFKPQQTGFNGIRCYSSTDLMTWTYVNDVLRPSSGELSPSAWVGRPDVIFNSSTGQYVMWAKFGGNAGVATSSSVCGNYAYRGSFKDLDGDDVEDSSLFKDADGSAYFIHTGTTRGSSSRNNIQKITFLTTDYLRMNWNVFKISVSSREAPQILRRNNTYYWITSDTDWWNSTRTRFRTATSLYGSWSGEAVMNTNPSSSNSFNTQHDFILAVQGSQTTSYIYAGDRYTNMQGMGVPAPSGVGRNAWFPLTWSGSTPTLVGSQAWSINAATGAWANGPSGGGGGGTNLVTNPGFESGASQTPTGWSEWSSAGHANASYSEASNPHSGGFTGTFWKASAYDVYAYQRKGGLATGLYTMKAWVKSSGGQSTARMEVKNHGGSLVSVNLPTTTSWQQITLSGINVTSGTADFGFYSIASANQWINFDDVEFFKQ